MQILVCDYREVPSTLAKQNPSKSEELLFDVISAVEMAEHVRIANFQPLLLHLPTSPYISLCLPVSPQVGIANFQLFLTNCRDMLKDDGLFYMQVAGLRKGSTGGTRSGASSCRATSSPAPTPPPRSSGTSSNSRWPTSRSRASRRCGGA